MFYELSQVRWVTTQKGEGYIWGIMDYGPDADTLYLVCYEDGQLWWVPQNELRASPNKSMYRSFPERLDK